jgi:hypothetical protein
MIRLVIGCSGVNIGNASGLGLVRGLLSGLVGLLGITFLLFLRFFAEKINI